MKARFFSTEIINSTEKKVNAQKQLNTRSCTLYVVGLKFDKKYDRRINERALETEAQQ